MMKKCRKCGKEYDEDMNFCPYCGIAAERVSDAESEAEEEKEPTAQELRAALEAAKAAGESKRIEREASVDETKDDEEEIEVPRSKLPMIIGITVIVGILIIAAVVVAIYFGTNKSGASKEYTKVVEEYMLGYQNKDVNRIMNTYPKFMQDNILSNGSAEDIWKDIDDSFSESLGDDWKATYTMGAVAEISESDIEALKSDLEATYNTKLDFTSGYWVAADMTLTGKGDTSTMPLIFAVVQIDGKWSIVYQTYNSTGTGSSSVEQNASGDGGVGQGSATE